MWSRAFGWINGSMNIAQETRLKYWVCHCPANNCVDNEWRRLAVDFLFDAFHGLQEHRMSLFPKFILIELHRLFPRTTFLLPLTNSLSQDFRTEQRIINTLPINGIFVMDSIPC